MEVMGKCFLDGDGDGFVIGWMTGVVPLQQLGTQQLV